MTGQGSVQHGASSVLGAVRFTAIEAADVPALTAIMRAAFDESSLRHTGIAHGGPPGYDTGEFLTRWAVGNPTAWAVHADTGDPAAVADAVVGAVITFPGADGHHTLGCLFVDPHAQRRGLGGQIWDEVSARFPDAESWTLETPEHATSNHTFYERRCGFRLLRTELDAEGQVSRVYRRAPGRARRDPVGPR